MDGEPKITSALKWLISKGLAAMRTDADVKFLLFNHICSNIGLQ